MLQNITYIVQLAIAAVLVIGLIKWYRLSRQITKDWTIVKRNLEEVMSEENRRVQAVNLLVPDSRTYESYIETVEQGVVVECKPCPRCAAGGITSYMVCRQYWPKVGSSVPYPMEIRHCPQCGWQEKTDLTALFREVIFEDRDFKSTLEVPEEYYKKEKP